MARLSCIVAIISIALMCILATAEEKYSDQYDGIDTKGTLENDKLREEYFKCYMETGPCVTEDAKFFKEMFGEALQNKCKKCTDKQKEIINMAEDWYTKNQPDKWEMIIAKSVENKKKNSHK